MRQHVFKSNLLLISVAAYGGLQQLARAQEAPTTSTIRLAVGSEPADTPPPLPAQQAAPQRTSELTFEQLHSTANGLAARDQNARALRQPNSVQQAAYIESQATQPLVNVPNYNRSRSLAGVYPSASAQATLNKLPRPAPVQGAANAPAPHAATQRGKPFQAIQADPTLSPYLNLYRTNLNPNMMPNYFALVRPQFEQQDMNRKQAEQIQRLQKQLQSSQGAGAAAASASNGNMTGPARYMDTGQFYQHSSHR